MISDSHTDFLTELNFDEREEYVKSLKVQNVKRVVAAVFTTNKHFSLEELRYYYKELETLKTKYSVDLIFAVEDLGFLKINEKEEFVKLKPFSTTLTWNFANKFAGGSNSNKGLTKLGKDIVEFLEENDVLIDTAHMSRKTFWKFSRVTSKPIFNSHSNIFSEHKHSRNLTDRQIQKIVDTNGFLGLTVYDNFIKGKTITSFDVAKQFDYLIKKFGFANFGFGTDFYGINKNHLPIDITNYKTLEDNVSRHLQGLGYNEEIIKCLMYKNFENFIFRQKKAEH